MIWRDMVAERMADEILHEHGRSCDETRGLVPLPPAHAPVARVIPELPAATYAAMLRGL